MIARYKIYLHSLTLLTMLCVWPTSTVADQVYLAPQDFLVEVFANAVPEPKVLWITKGLRADTRAIMTHSKGPRRIRYWTQSTRSAWILEEIGKVKPITTGIVINDGHIERVTVLIYRESRGWELRHSFFTDQFIGARLVENHRLSRSIDGISGATLSVSALTRLSRLALYLHEQISPD